MPTSTVSKFPDQTTLGSPERGDLGLSNALALYAMNRIYATANIGIATTTQKVRTQATATYTLGGVFQTAVSSTDNVWTLSGTAVSASSYQKYLLLWDSTGASGVSIQEGVQSTVGLASVGWTNANAVSAWGPLITLLDAGKVIVGYITVATNSSTTFTPGTTALNAAGVTVTYNNGIDATLLPVIGNLGASIVGSGV